MSESSEEKTSVFNEKFSPEMIQMGLSAGKHIISKQSEAWIPQVSQFWLGLKFYFSVSNSYVVKKLSHVLYPLGNKSWTRISVDELPADDPSSETEHYGSKWALPKQDVNSPDLYIPVMAFVTYILLCGLVTGISSAFTPEVLSNAVWRCLLLVSTPRVVLCIACQSIQ